jgi:hypothetical protein
MTHPVNKLTVEEFNAAVQAREVVSTAISSIKQLPIMQESTVVINRDPDAFESAHNAVIDALTYASTSPSADDMVRMLMYMLSSYPIKPFPLQAQDGLFAADGVNIYINPSAVYALNADVLVAVMIHEIGHIFLDDMAAHRCIQRMLDNINLPSGDEAVPRITQANANLFIDPCVDWLAMQTANVCKAVDGEFVKLHYNMCVDKVQALLTVALGTGARCDNDDHYEQFTNGADSMYQRMCKQPITSVDPTALTINNDKWHLLVSMSQLIARAVDVPADSGGNAGAGLGDVIDNDNTSVADIIAKRDAAVNNAAKSCGKDPGNYGISNTPVKPSNCIDDYLPHLLTTILGGEDTYSTTDPVMAGFGASLPVDDLAPASVGIALDVSGSVVFSQEDFGVLLGELSTALKSPLVKELVLVLFDYGEIRDENVFVLPNGADIEAVLAAASGGGGTEFDTPITKLQQISDDEDTELGMMVMLTDGVANFDADKHSDDIPRVWISTHADTQRLDPAHQHILLQDRRDEGVRQ